MQDISGEHRHRVLYTFTSTFKKVIKFYFQHTVGTKISQYQNYWIQPSSRCEDPHRKTFRQIIMSIKKAQFSLANLFFHFDCYKYVFQQSYYLQNEEVNNNHQILNISFHRLSCWEQT